MKRHLFFTVALLILVAAWEAGCGGQPTAMAPPDEAQSAETTLATPTIEPRREEATVTPASVPEPTEVKPPAEAEEAVRLAREDLAGRLGLAPEAIRLVSAEAVEWRDSSLGCPQPGMLYAQVITPGFLVELEADDKPYEYHTDTKDHLVLCQPEESGQGATLPISPLAAPEADVPVGAEAAIRLAIEDLAGRLGLAPEAIQPVSVEAVEWSDTSLGCPQPGMMYAQVITPGFLVDLEAGGKWYEYHTDEGRFVVLCEK